MNRIPLLRRFQRKGRAIAQRQPKTATVAKCEMSECDPDGITVGHHSFKRFLMEKESVTERTFLMSLSLGF